MTIDEWATRLRYRYVPDHVVGEVLGRKWMDNVIPIVLLIALTVFLAETIPNFTTLGNLSDTSRQIGEFGLIVIGMTIVMLGGGIDLSVGSIFALANVTSLALINVGHWPVPAAVAATIAVGALVGLVNGVLIGFLRLRAFLTTLVVLTLIRSIVEFLLHIYSVEIASSDVESDAWDFIGSGSILGAPFSVLILAVVAIIAQVVLTRLRIGWRIMAVGGSRRAAYNAGIPVRSMVCLTYVVSGVLTSLAGTLYAARLSGAGPDTGLGLELAVVTAALLGGNSVGGGRGSVGKALMGAIIVSLLTNGLVRLGLQNGASSLTIGLVLVLAIAIDVRWGKWRHRLRAKVYVSPAYLALPSPPGFVAGSSSPYAINDRLSQVEIIGLNEIDGPEDVILDEAGHLYCGVRHGEIIRFFGPDYSKREVYAHVGGRPLGLAFDREGGLNVCIAGMGLYRVDKERNVQKLTAETNRSPFSIIDDFPHAPCRRSRHWPRRQDLFQRGDDPLRLRRMGGRRPGGARQRPDHSLRSRYRNDADDPAQSPLRQRRLRRSRQQVRSVRGDLGLPRQPILARRPQGRNGRERHLRPSRLSRQHQSRVKRRLLGRAGRDANAELRPCDDHAGFPTSRNGHRRGRSSALHVPASATQ